MRAEALVLVVLAGCYGEVSRDPVVRLNKVEPGSFSSRGGEVLKLDGSGFTTATTVKLGDEDVKVKFVSDHQLELTTPKMVAGEVELSATSGGGAVTRLRTKVKITPMELSFVEAPPHVLPLEAGLAVTSGLARDFDGNRTVDLLLCGAGKPCRLLRNDGRGNFTGPVGVDGGELEGPAPVEGRLLASADLDGDGDFDLLLAGADGRTLASANDGNANFTPVVLGFGVDAGVSADGGVGSAKAAALTAVAFADFDSDGKVDLFSAGATPAKGPFRIELNASTRDALAFNALELGLSARDFAVTALALGDLDHDTRLDVVLATTGGSDGIALRVFLNRGSTFFELPGGLPGAGPYRAIAVRDFDGDSVDDVVAVGAGQDRLLLNDGSGHFFDASALALPLDAAQGTSLAVADLDFDADLDLVIGNTAATMRLYLNDGRGKFIDRTPALPRRNDTVLSVGIANFDGDSDEDLFVLPEGAAAVRAYLSVAP